MSTPYDDLPDDLKPYYITNEHGNAHPDCQAWRGAPSADRFRLSDNITAHLRRAPEAGDPKPLVSEPPVKMVYAVLVHRSGHRSLWAIDERLEPEMLNDADVWRILNDGFRDLPEETRRASKLVSSGNEVVSNFHVSRPVPVFPPPGKGL